MREAKYSVKNVNVVSVGDVVFEEIKKSAYLLLKKGEQTF